MEPRRRGMSKTASLPAWTPSSATLSPHRSGHHHHHRGTGGPPVSASASASASSSASSSSAPSPAASPASAPATPRLSSRMSFDAGAFFGAWRHRSTKEMANLDGKRLREAVWKQQQQQQQQQAAQRGLRVLRYTPDGDGRPAMPHHDDHDGDNAIHANDDGGSGGLLEEDDDGAAFAHIRTRGRQDTVTAAPSSTSSTDPHHHHHNGNGSNSSSRRSLSFGRLSLSTAEHKARKYDVDWKRDHECPDCHLCHLSFTKFSRRRHHCRVCGEVICGDCSLDQVHLAGRFSRPKRACAACFGLLEAMMHVGDRRLKLFCETAPGSKDWTNATPSSTDDGAAHPATSGRYRDRLAEMQRVAAAGKRARRGEGRRCVISASWLRAWIAYTRAAVDEDGSEGKNVPFEELHGLLGGSGGGDSMAVNGSMNSTEAGDRRARSMSSAFDPDKVADPGPIQNVALVELRQGSLVPRRGLIRCPSTAGGAGLDSSPEASRAALGDYQLIPLEVWEVFYRYYGGGPMIEYIEQDPGAPQWVIDAPGLLRGGRAMQQSRSAGLPLGSTISAPPVTVEDKLVERLLAERHDPFNILVDVSSSNMSHHDTLSTPRGGAPPPSPMGGGGYGRPPALARHASDVPPPRDHPPAPSRKFSVSSGPTPTPTATTTYRIPRPRQVRHADARTVKTPQHGTTSTNGGLSQPWREPELEPTEGLVLMAPPPLAHEDNILRVVSDAPPCKRPTTPPQLHQPPVAEPTAARAASAFALAMKEARLRQQQAIAGGGRMRPRDGE